jgi:hypothetical protein
MPQPRIGHIGQKYPPPLAAQIPMSMTFTAV